jgi:hypothetical protein
VSRFLFPKWTNHLPTAVAVAATAGGCFAVALFWYYGTNKYFEVGYQPKQPVEYSHKLHAGDLGMDCRYCHSTVERSSFAAVPPTQTCMNCHTKVRADSALLLPVRESFATDKPIPWVRVHNLPDYVYFDHRAHLHAGVGCSTCHGRVDQMPRITQEKPLTMGWCLDCHRNPQPYLRPAGAVTDMTWQPAPDAEIGVRKDVGNEGAVAVAADGHKVNPPTHCSGCHR